MPEGRQLPADADDVDEGLQVQVLAVDSSNNALSGVRVQFTASSGAIVVSAGTTGTDGIASATLTTGGDPAIRTIALTAASGGKQDSDQAQVVAPTNNNPPQPSLGRLNPDGSFEAGAIAIGLTTLPAGGSTGLRVDIVDVANNNAVITDAVDVTFVSPCITATTSAVTPNPAVSFSGAANTNYVASGCSGSDLITARATVNGSNLQATGTITVQAANLGSIEFVSAVPSNIGLQGSGQPETSTVTFRVKNNVGGIASNVPVTFALNTTVGGITLAPASGTSNAQGLVQTVVRAGTVATTVRVTATATQGANTVSSQSELLTITTGLPDQNSFSLSATTLNAEGLTRDGTIVPVTIRAADRFNNPVPNGTAINFRTEGGDIVGSCTTTGGACTVNWESQDPRAVALGPSRPGRSTILAYAIGEESFKDADGDGLYDSGETFGDLPEAFQDDDEDNSRDTSTHTEEFIDFNSSGTYNLQDGQFNGLLCDAGGNVPTQCTGRPTTVNVRASLVLVMSGSSPVIDATGDVTVTRVGTAVVTYIPTPVPTIQVSDAGAASIAVVVRDVNDQPMPSGTTVVFTVFGGGELLGTSDFVVPSTNDDSAGTNTYGVTYKAPDLEAGDPDNTALVELAVTSPAGLKTVFNFTVITGPPSP